MIHRQSGASTINQLGQCVRLACIRHTAGVHPEPGSNSHIKYIRTVGELLAGYIQRELAARTGLLDCRTHPRTWDIFTRTRCPAVRVEIGYLTNGQDRLRLSDPAFRDVVAEGLLISVKRLYLLGEGDQPTGTFTFADVLAHELAKAE